MGARKPGESASGGVNVRQTPTQRAAECSNQIVEDPDAAFECFEGVLEDDPKNAVALTWSAWQLSLAAPSAEDRDRITLQALAAVRLESAVEADPNYSYARAFRAIVAYRNGRYAEAQQYLEEFRERDPSAQAVQIIEQMDLEANIERALAADAQQVTGASSETTTPDPDAPPPD
jgi:lipoprotein NlpI